MSSVTPRRLLGRLLLVVAHLPLGTAACDDGPGAAPQDGGTKHDGTSGASSAQGGTTVDGGSRAGASGDATSGGGATGTTAPGGGASGTGALGGSTAHGGAGAGGASTAVAGGQAGTAGQAGKAGGVGTAGQAGTAGAAAGVNCCAGKQNPRPQSWSSTERSPQYDCDAGYPGEFGCCAKYDQCFTPELLAPLLPVSAGGAGGAAGDGGAAGQGGESSWVCPAPQGFAQVGGFAICGGFMPLAQLPSQGGLCCYTFNPGGCCGRPMLEDGVPRVAPLARGGGGWAC